MRYRTMGKTGWQISEVSLGGAYLMGNDPERAQESTNEVVRRALELGINYIDTAPLYGKSEELLGGALEGVAEHFYIATKVGYDPPNFDYRGDSVLWSIERSLQRMRIPKLATAQIHEVNMAGWERITEPGGTLEGLREAQKRGLCERIGITGRAIPLLAKTRGHRGVRYDAGISRLSPLLAKGSESGYSGGCRSRYGGCCRHTVGGAVVRRRTPAVRGGSSDIR